MTLRECYQEFSGDYDEVQNRLLKPERIEKYMLKFLEDPSYEDFCKAYEAGDYEEAFRSIHMLKGVSQNLGFQALFLPCNALTELLRNGGTVAGDDTKLLQDTENMYRMTIEAIQKYKDAVCGDAG